MKKIVVFDLDDTLYKEIDFLKSGYRKVSELIEKSYGLNRLMVYDHLLDWYKKGENPFDCLNKVYGLDIPIGNYLNVYRYHIPDIFLVEDVRFTLISLQKQGVTLGIITDGREETQKNKIEALGLWQWINPDLTFVNEDYKYFKPNHWSYERLMLRCCELFQGEELSYVYVGDNIEKDFVTPNELGWISVCLLDDGKNIHRQHFDVESRSLPKYKIETLSELKTLI